MFCVMSDLTGQGRGENTLAIDPSIRALGWSVFRGKGYWESGLIRHRHKKNAWIKACSPLIAAVAAIMRQHDCGTAVIEMPQQFHSARGKKARDNESIQKLYFFVGGLSRAMVARGARVVLVNPSTWKGTVPKAITAGRVLGRYGVSGDHNVIDAVGIGDWWVRKHKGAK